MTEKQSSILRIGILILVGLLFLAGTLCALLWTSALRQPDTFAAFQALIDSFGLWGLPVLLVIQYVQIVLAFLPGGPVQMVAGALYGPLVGLILCLTGIFLATATIFGLARRYGTKIIALFVGQDHKDHARFLARHPRQLEPLVLLLFFLPGTPKDALTYFFALTPIRFSRFFLLSALARLPAMVASLFAGNSLREGDWRQAGLLFLVMTVLGGVGIFLHHRLLRHRDKPPDK